MTSDHRDTILKITSAVPYYSVWCHYNGSVYKVHDVIASLDDSADGLIVIRRIDGPGYDALLEQGVSYSVKFSEWFDEMNSDGDKRFVRAKKVIMWIPENDK